MDDSEKIVRNIIGDPIEFSNERLTKKMYSDTDTKNCKKDQEGFNMADLTKAKSEADTKVQHTVNKEAAENEKVRNRVIKNIIG